MKKILIIVAVSVVSFATQAASFKWTAANVYASDLTSKYTGTATLYAYLTSAGAETAVEVAVGDIANGVVKSGNTTGLTFSSDDFVNGQSYTFYFVIEDAGKTFTSATKAASASNVGASSIGFGSLASATQNAGNWSAVPEPTGAMLIALGVAALALRRRRA